VRSCETMESTKQAYIFDFDGVLVNTMPAHFACYKQALAEAGVPIDREQFYSQAGMTGLEQIRYFIRKAGVCADPQAVYRRKREIWSEDPPSTEPIACNLEWLRLLRAAGVPVAIATGSSLSSIEPIMATHGIEVDAVAAADDVERGKPFPDLFLCGAQKLGVSPGNCTVVEDSDVGIEAAAAAGMCSLRFYARSPDDKPVRVKRE